MNKVVTDIFQERYLYNQTLNCNDNMDNKVLKSIITVLREFSQFYMRPLHKKW